MGLGRCAHLRGAGGQQREVPLVQAALASILPHHRVYRQVTVHQRVMEPPAQKQDIFSSPYLDLVPQLRLLSPPNALISCWSWIFQITTNGMQAFLKNPVQHQRARPTHKMLP